MAIFALIWPLDIWGAVLSIVSSGLSNQYRKLSASLVIGPVRMSYDSNLLLEQGSSATKKRLAALRISGKAVLKHVTAQLKRKRNPFFSSSRTRILIPPALTLLQTLCVGSKSDKVPISTRSYYVLILSTETSVRSLRLGPSKLPCFGPGSMSFRVESRTSQPR